MKEWGCWAAKTEFNIIEKSPLVGFFIPAGTSNPLTVKQFKQQTRIVKEVMHSRKLSPDIHQLVKGVMIESYIEEGCQKIGNGIYGKSITDPCLGWEDSERLIYDIADYE